MLRVLFWNVQGRDAAFEQIPALVGEFLPNVLTLIEAPEGAEAQLHRLGVAACLASSELDNPRRLLTFALDERLHLTQCLSNRHHRAYQAAFDGHEPLNLVAVHLQSPVNDKGDATGRPQKRAEKCREFVEGVEDITGHTRTIVFGDFNMDPFALAMVNIDGLNAMNTAWRARSHRTSEETTRATFYNPMWSMFGDRRPMPDGRASPPGTYYVDDDGPAGYFWHMPDQVLLRGDLSSHLTRLDVVDQVGGSALVSRKARRPNLSDHLPVVFELCESVWRRRDEP